jgi:hypothetical protein
VARATEARQQLEEDSAAGIAEDEGAAGQLEQLTTAGASELEGMFGKAGLPCVL